MLKLARDGLALELRSLINAARKKNAPVRKNDFAFDDNGQKRILNLSVSPLGQKRSSQRERHFLVLFEDITSHGILGFGDERQPGKARAGTNRELKRLKQELADTQDALRAAVESEDATKEEFQSANEEILSANEELQSTNEELETSKEELQSANEELNTLNAELRHKNTELHDLSNDLANLLNSTRLPVVMLDNRLLIRRLTPKAYKLLKVVPSDVGRPISDIKLNIQMDDLEAMVAKVLSSLQPSQCDVQDREGHWQSLHILPYKTLDNKIDGAVLVLQDIDAIKTANEQLRRSSELFYAIINTVRQPLLVLDSDLRVMTVNQSFLHTFKVLREQTVNKFLYRLGDEQWNIPKLRALLEEVLPQDQAVTDFEVEHDFAHIGHRKMVLNARRIVQGNSRDPMILLAIEDITERKRAEAALIQSEKLAASGRLAASLAHEINNPLQAVMNLMTLFGQSAKLDAQDREYATLAGKELGRVVRLIRQSLGLYQEAASPTAMNVEEVLESILNLYVPQMRDKQITVTRQFRLDGTLESYAGDIRQVFSTLLINAIEATPQGGHAVLRAGESLDWRKNPPVSGVRITLADNGPGIPAHDMARIFEPFFTTKGERGTGLGLWVTQGIVDRLGGSIRVRSTTRPGKSGTCFSIFFPHRRPQTALAPGEISKSA